MTLDDESIVNEDVVLWISEKFLHIPCAEDVPMTISVKRGFTLKPFNYFDSTPVFDLPAFYSDSVDPYDYQQCPEEK
ncbi:hypothetical protein DPMN_036759 [Dreissena polymorpha]|nr:hypothetical protein DPMN_036759 [Dreissena polymorpha]